jgi:hypothetical protein
LGYDVWFVIDAMHTFAKTANGVKLSAQQLSDATAVNLQGDFAEVIETVDAIKRLER